MIRRQRSNALKKQRTQLVGKRKIGERFAVNKALAFDDLQPHRADQLSLHILRHLEFRHLLRQLVRRETHRLPECRQRPDVIQSRAPNAVVHGVHFRRIYDAKTGFQGAKRSEERQNRVVRIRVPGKLLLALNFYDALE